MNLRADLRQLTDDQPVQPGDRLGAVTRRAGRIRRTRAVVSVAAVVAVAVPVGALALRPHRAATPQYAGVATWPDRSQAGHRGIGQGALAAWANEHPDEGRVSWLFRGVVSRPGRQAQYVALWRTPSTVVLASGETNQLDEQGMQVGHPGEPGGWGFVTSPLATAPRVLGLYVGTISPEQHYETSLFALAAPTARRLHWSSQGLPFAVLDGGGPTDRQGDLVSRDGVFVDDVGSLAGPVVLDDPAGGTQPFGLGDQQAQLAQPPAPDVPFGFIEHTGGAGATDAHTFTGPMYATYDNASRPTVTAVRCYGGGTLRLTFHTTPFGRAACDGQTHTFSTPPSRRADALTIAGDRLQSYRFSSGVLTAP